MSNSNPHANSDWKHDISIKIEMDIQAYLTLAQASKEYTWIRRNAISVVERLEELKQTIIKDYKE